MSPASELERALLPMLHEEAQMLSQGFPHIKFNAGSSSVGSATSYQGHLVWLECVFPEAAPDKTDSLSIVIRAMHLSTEPKLSEASVVWGNGQLASGEADLIAEPIFFTKEALCTLAERVPQLLVIFRGAIHDWQASAAMPNPAFQRTASPPLN